MANFHEAYLNIDKLADIFEQEMVVLIGKNVELAKELIKNQIWDGKTGLDEDIRPYYSEDPFFKTIEQAIKYRDWKQRITPNSERNPDAPNLFINGKFYSEIDAKATNEGIYFGGSGSLSIDVKNKYDNIYLLGLNSKKEFLKTIKKDIEIIVNKTLKLK